MDTFDGDEAKKREKSKMTWGCEYETCNITNWEKREVRDRRITVLRKCLEEFGFRHVFVVIVGICLWKCFIVLSRKGRELGK